MGKLVIDRGNFTDLTSVSNLFIDEYMPNANGEFVKIYLYLLRLVSGHSTEITTDALADLLCFTESDVERGLSYWERLGLISLSRDEDMHVNGIRMEAYTTNKFYVKSILNSSGSQVSARIPAKRKYTSKEISAFSKDPRVQQLTFLAQTYLGKTLNSNDVNSILYMIDGLNLSSDFIEYLMEMCISSGNNTLGSIEKSAVNYYKRGITTIDDIKFDTKIRKSIYKSVFKIFGLTDQNAAKKDVNYISKWTETYNFSEDIIVEACNRTMEHTHTASFPYADTILKGWYNNGITELSQVEQLDEEHAKEVSEKFSSLQASKASNKSCSASLKKFKNMDERTYDSIELEKMLLSSTNRK